VSFIKRCDSVSRQVHYFYTINIVLLKILVLSVASIYIDTFAFSEISTFEAMP